MRTSEKAASTVAGRSSGILPKTMASLFGVCLCIAFTAGSAQGTSFTVGDADFVGGVYDFHFYTRPPNDVGSETDRTVINGVDQGISNPTLTNGGWNSATDGSVSSWQANSASSGFGSVFSAVGDLTMGWDFSAVTQQIATIELKTRHFLFQFDQWSDEAYLDEIAAYLSTPATFGTGAETELYRFTGNKPLNNDGNPPQVLGSGTLNDITAFVAASWLVNPGLLELRLAYELANLDIPGRHLQAFRDDTGVGDDGFVFRVTLQSPAPVPLPAALPFFVASVGLLGLVGWRGQRAASRIASRIAC